MRCDRRAYLRGRDPARLPTEITVTSRGNLAFTFDASSARLAFQRVSAEEYAHSDLLGTYVRKAVLLRHNGVYYYGQVRSYNFTAGTLNVRTSIGPIDAPLLAVVPVDAPLVMLLFEHKSLWDPCPL